jgi:hypothetical protein
MSNEPQLRLLIGYLATLRAQLGLMPDAERFLTEAEAHLYEAIVCGVADGLSLQDAQRAAIARFGDVRTVADAALGQTPQPLVFDVRDGLTQAAIDALKRATRLALLLRDGHTAALGYWIDDRFGGALLVRRRDARSDLTTTANVAIRAVETSSSAAWRNVICPALHIGMHLHAEVWAGRPRLWFGPFITSNQVSLEFASGRRAVQMRLE